MRTMKGLGQDIKNRQGCHQCVCVEISRAFDPRLGMSPILSEFHLEYTASAHL